MDKILKFWKIALIIMVSGFFLFIFYQYSAISGNLHLRYDFSSKPTLITEISPIGRATNRLKDYKTGETYQIISGEPVYFTASAPRSFDSAEVLLTYNNPSQKIIELGIRKSADWLFELKPLENKFIDDSKWPRLKQDNLILLQKSNDFKSVNDFINNLPKDKKIVFYNYQPKYNFIMADYQPSNAILEISSSVRGQQEFLTYLGNNEDLDFSFNWIDLNGDTNDKISIKVLKGDAEIFSDGSSIQKEQEIFLTQMSEGLYRIILSASDDIIFSQIKTKQRYLVLKNKMYLYANTAENIYTNCDKVLFYTKNMDGLQNVLIDNENYNVDELETFLTWKNQKSSTGELKIISIPMADLLMQGSCYFSFTKDSFFDPDYGFDSLKSDADIERYDYFLAADYTAPSIKQNWKTASQKFDLTGVPGDRKTLEFTISVTGIADVKDNITIKEIEIKLKRQPISLKNLWNKIK